MAPLDAKFQTAPDPEYLRYSRPIQQPAADQSGAILAKGLGEAAADTIGGIDKTVGAYAENKAYERGEVAKKQEEDRLTAQEAQLGIGQSTNENSEVRATQFQPSETDGSQSLIQKNQDLPAEIRFGTRTAGSLKERFDNGKISQTDYKSEVDKIAKDLNSQFPLWRQDISKGLERATGVAGADAAIQARVSRINQLLAQINEGRNKLISKVLDAAKFMPPDAAQSLYEGVISGRISEGQAVHAISQAEYADTVIRRTKAQIELDKDVRGEGQVVAGNRVDDIANGIKFNHMNGILVANGTSTPTELIEKLQAGRMDPNDPLMVKVAGQLRNAFDAEEKEIRQALLPHTAALGGQAKVEEKVKEHMAYHKAILEQLADPAKAGNAVTAALQDTHAIESQIGNQFAKDPFGRKLKILKLATDQSPALAGEIMRQQFQNEKDFGTGIGDMMRRMQQGALAINPKDIQNRPGNANADVDRLVQMGANPKAIQGHVKFVGMLADRGMPDDQAYNLAKYFFKSENQGLVGKFSREAYNPQTGKTSEGMINTFGAKGLGSKDVADRIYDLAKNPKYADIRTDYVNFMENTFSHEVFPSLLMSMRDVTLGAGDRLGYSPKDMHFHIDTKPGVAGSSSTFVRNTVGQLNYALDSMREIAIHENKDPNAYLIKLIQAGNPDAFTKEVPGFPSNINSAIANQTLAKEMEKRKQEEAMKKAAGP